VTLVQASKVMGRNASIQPHLARFRFTSDT
jgi:hypothetical protein